MLFPFTLVIDIGDERRLFPNIHHIRVCQQEKQNALFKLAFKIDDDWVLAVLASALRSRLVSLPWSAWLLGVCVGLDEVMIAISDAKSRLSYMFQRSCTPSGAHERSAFFQRSRLTKPSLSGAGNGNETVDFEPVPGEEGVSVSDRYYFKGLGRYQLPGPYSFSVS